MEQTKQGIFPSGLSIPYTCPSGKRSKVGIRVNCAEAYTFKVLVYSAALNNTVIMYDLTLDAGDTVVDNTLYSLYPGDQFQVEVDVATVNYTMQIIEL